MTQVAVSSDRTARGVAPIPAHRTVFSDAPVPITRYREFRVSTTPIPPNSAEARRLEEEGWQPVWVRNYTEWVGGADVPDKWRLEYERDVPPPKMTLAPGVGPLAVWSLVTMPGGGLARAVGPAY